MRLDSTKHHSPKRENGLQEIEQRFKGKTSRGSDILAQHSHDESFHLPSRPDIVVFAESTEDVSDCLAICTRHQLPVIPFGVGTSLEGHVNALFGGVSLDSKASLAADIDQQVGQSLTQAFSCQLRCCCSRLC